MFFSGFCDPLSCHAHFIEKVHPLPDALIHYEGLFIACVTKLNDIGQLPVSFILDMADLRKLRRSRESDGNRGQNPTKAENLFLELNIHSPVYEYSGGDFRPVRIAGADRNFLPEMLDFGNILGYNRQCMNIASPG